MNCINIENCIPINIPEVLLDERKNMGDMCEI